MLCDWNKNIMPLISLMSMSIFNIPILYKIKNLAPTELYSVTPPDF